MFLAVAASPQVRMPPPSGSRQQDKNRKKQRDNKRELHSVLRGEVSRIRIQRKGEGHQYAGDQNKNQKNQHRAADAHAEIRNPSMLRKHCFLLFNCTGIRRGRVEWLAVRSPQGEAWARRDSNPHAVRHKILNLACLPISPHAQSYKEERVKERQR